MVQPRNGLSAWILTFSMLAIMPVGFAISITDDPFSYSDTYTDSESHNQYLNARYYNPEVMHFVSLDSLSLFNRYAYADSNPISNSDPSGHNAFDVLNGVNNFLNNDIFQYVFNGLNISASVRDMLGVAAGGEFAMNELPFLFINDLNNVANSGMAIYSTYANQNGINVSNSFNNAMFATGMVSSAFTNAGDALEYANNKKAGSSAWSKFLWFNNMAMTASSGMLYPGNNFGNGFGQLANVTSNVTTVISDLGSFQDGLLPKRSKENADLNSDSSKKLPPADAPSRSPSSNKSGASEESPNSLAGGGSSASNSAAEGEERGSHSAPGSPLGLTPGSVSDLREPESEQDNSDLD